MISEIHQHPDKNDIYIRTDQGVYVDTADNFAADCKAIGLTEPLPVLPEGAIERIYQQSVRHPITDGNNVIAGGPMPWEYGDQIIASVQSLLDAQAKRQPPKPTPYQTKGAEIRGMCETTIASGFKSSALGAPHAYQSDAASLASLTLAVSLNDSGDLWCADNKSAWALRTHTSTQLLQVIRDGRAMIVAAQRKCAALLSQVASAPNEHALSAIEW